MMRARQQFKGVVRPLIEQDTAHQFQALSRSCLGITMKRYPGLLWSERLCGECSG